jgi:chaperone required for assembly of F1-ATPase
MSTDDQPNGNPPNDPMRAARANMQQPLPKRFYTTATADTDSDGRHRVLLDGRQVRTPKKGVLTLPTRALAEAVAAEWQAQTGVIDPARMPLTRFADTALDGVVGQEAEVAADIAKYCDTDLLYYRAERPEGLTHRQAELWDPILAWASDTLGVRFQIQTGIMPVAQSPGIRTALEPDVAKLDAFALTALHVMTTLMGSALLALAVRAGRLDVSAAWAAAHVDEDWQIAEWGEDDEATERRRRRYVEMVAAGRFLELTTAPAA